MTPELELLTKMLMLQNDTPEGDVVRALSKECRELRDAYANLQAVLNEGVMQCDCGCKAVPHRMACATRIGGLEEAVRKARFEWDRANRHRAALKQMVAAVSVMTIHPRVPVHQGIAAAYKEAEGTLGVYGDSSYVGDDGLPF